MTWQVDAADFGGTVVNFSQGAHPDLPATEQFPWMTVRFNMTPLTTAGCCMALTVNFFDWYLAGKDVKGYFKWLQTPSGISKVMNMQTKYLGWSTSFGNEPTRTGNDVGRFLNALKRKVEDEIYRSLNYADVHSPFFPSRLGSLADEVTKDFSKEGRVFKPIYLAALSGAAHAIGAILDYKQSRYLFFRSQRRVAEFLKVPHMKTWLERVEPEYKDNYDAFFADTKKRSK